MEHNFRYPSWRYYGHHNYKEEFVLLPGTKTYIKQSMTVPMLKCRDWIDRRWQATRTSNQYS